MNAVIPKISAPPLRRQPAFTVATYNIHAGRGVDRRYRSNRIAGTLEDADYVAMQEVDSHRFRTRFDNQIQQIADRLCHRHYVHFPAERHIGSFGNATTTRLPLLAT